MTGPDIDFEQPTAVQVMRGELIDYDGLDQIPEPQWLIDKILVENSIAWLYGSKATLKSFVALDWACCVSVGESWQGRPTRQSNVVYMVAEGLTGIRKRAHAWKANDRRRPKPAVRFLGHAVQIMTSGFDTFREMCEEDKIGLIILDTQARVTVGVEENSSTEMGVVMEKLDRLRRMTGATVLIIHHASRAGENGRGSNAMDGGVDTIIRTLRDEGSDELTLHNEKQKDSAEFEDIHLRTIPVGDSLVLGLDDEERLVPDHEYVNRSLAWRKKWWHTYREVETSLSTAASDGVVSKATFGRHKQALLRFGLLIESGSGRLTQYRLPARPTELTQ